MKRIFQSKGFLRKIAIVVLVLLLCYCIIPTYTYAGFGGDILKVFVQLLAALGDVVTGALNHFMLGTDALINSVMLEQDNPTITKEGAALYAPDDAKVDLVLDQQQDAAGNTGDDNEENSETSDAINAVKEEEVEVKNETNEGVEVRKTKKENVEEDDDRKSN